jgi:D-amino-acid dehydrogenase
MRQTTPDDLPFIGTVPGFGHLYVATGHGMLGVTLAPATGAALAPLVLEDHTVPELEPFGLDRFAGRHANRSSRQRHQQKPDT